MFLNAIKFRGNQESTPSVWRFSKGTGNFTNFQYFHGSHLELKQFYQALVYALTGRPNSHVVEVAVQMTEETTGDAWIIERIPGRTRMLRNNKLLEADDVSKTLLASFLDLDDFSIEDEESIQKAVLQFNLKYEDQSLVSVPSRDDHPGARKINEITNKNIEESRQRIASLLRQPQFADINIIEKLRKHAQPLHRSYMEISRQQANFLAKNAKSHQIAPQDLANLESELELAEKIEAICLPLLDPKATVKTLKEKQARLEEQISQTLKSCDLEKSPNIDKASLPWEKMIQTLARMIAYEHLINGSERILGLISEQTLSVATDYTNTLSNLISADNQVIQELESCLATLRINMENQGANPNASFKSLVDKFIKPGGLQDEKLKGDRLENARLAVDYALARLGELHGSISNSNEAINDVVDKLRVRREAYVSEHGKLKRLWGTLCKETDVPEHLNLKQLMSLLKHFAQLRDSEIQLADIRNQMKERKVALQTLETLLQQWRELTQSQKESPSANPAILVSEAQGVIRYLPKKRAQLEKMHNQMEEGRANEAIRSNLSHAQAQTMQMWNKLFKDWQLPEITIENETWDECFAIATEINAWRSIKNETRKPAKGPEIFTDQVADAPINLYSCLAAESSNAQRIAVLQAVEEHKSTSLQVLLTSDSHLVSMFGNLGIGGSRSLKPEQQKKIPPKSKKILDLLNHGAS